MPPAEPELPDAAAAVSGESPGGAAAIRSLMRNAFALHANTAITSLLGFAFVAIASRLYEPERLGRDLALVSAMMLLAAISELNFGFSLPRFIPRLGKRSTRAVLTAYCASSIVAFVLAVLFVVVVPRLSANFSYLQASVGLCVIFVAAVVIWNIFAVQDSILTALRQAIWVPVENGLFGLMKLLLMIWWATSTIEHGVFYAWALPMALLAVPITILLFGMALPRYVRSAPQPTRSTEEEWGGRRAIVKFLGLDYVASLTVQGATTVLPIVVYVILGGEANATFAIAFLIISAVEQLNINASLSLTVESSLDESKLRSLVRHTMARSGLMQLLIVGGGMLLTPLILVPFDDQYSDTVPTVLRLLLLGVLAEGVIDIYKAIQRIHQNATKVLIATAAQMALVLTGAIALAPHFGLAGVGWAWLIGHSIVAAATLPTIIRVMR